MGPNPNNPCCITCHSVCQAAGERATGGRKFYCPTCKKEWREFSEDNLRENKIQEARLLLATGFSRKTVERSTGIRHSIVREAAERYSDEIIPKPNPCCLGCKHLMQSFGPNKTRYYCPRCHVTVTIMVSARAAFVSRVEDLIRDGRGVREIIAATRSHAHTVKRIREQMTDVPDCPCGKPLQHRGDCATVKARGVKRLGEQRTFFDTLIMRLDRAVPRILPEEMRADVQQDMLLDVLKSASEIINSVKVYIKRYNHEYPQRRNSLDDPYSGAARQFGDNSTRLAS